MSIGTVLATGGAGFIGSALAQRLSNEADRWVVVDSMHSQVHADRGRPSSLPDDVEFVLGDVVEPATWDEVLNRVRPDVVIHLAAETGTGQSLGAASRHALTNVVGCTRMLDAFTAAGHRPAHLVLPSSRAVYGEGRWVDDGGHVRSPGARTHAQLAAGQWDFPGARPLPSSAATTTPTPTSVYGATKHAQETVLGAWSSAMDVPLSILRLQNVYGVGQSLINPYTGIVSLFSRVARGGEAIEVFEDGEVVRDFVYIDDVVEAFAAVVRRGPVLGAVPLDIGSGEATTLLQLARVIASFHGAPAPRISGRFRDGDVRHASVDVAETIRTLEWRPRWSLESGIAELQSWIDQSIAPRQADVAG